MQALSSKKQASKKRKLFIAGIIVVLVIIAGASVYAYQQKIAADKQRDSSTVNEGQTKPDKQPHSQTPQKPGQSTPENPAPTPEPEENTGVTPEKPTIERAGGDPVIKVVASFQNASEGHCELKLTKDGQAPQTFRTNVVVSTSYYVCTFAVERSSISTTSPWKAVVSHVIGAKSTDSDVKEIL